MGSLIKLATWEPRPDVAAAPEFQLSEAARFFSEHKGAVLLAALVARMAAANGSCKL